jgi:WD40 repeat protein
LGLFDRVRAILSTDDKQLAFETALARAYTAFARHYPMWTASLFDEYFLKSEPVIELLAKLLTRRGRPDPKEFARLFANHIGQHYSEHRERLIDDVTPAAADFLKWLEAELENQEVLRPLYDSRALAQIAQNTEAIRQALESNYKAAMAEAKRYAQVVGNVSKSTIVAGDHNVVTQIFLSGDYASLSDLYIPPDPVFKRVRLKDFIGREWLTADLDRFLSKHKCGVWLLDGKAGVGKTAFLAHLVRERGYLHFFAEQAPGPAGVTRALQSLAAQLVSRYRLEPYTSREHLSPSLASAPDFLERLLNQAAERLITGEQLVIVVDALDEAGVGSNGNPLGLPKTLPEGVFLILSQREGVVPLRIDPYPRIVHLKADDQNNLNDIDAYLSAIAGRLSAGSDHAADTVTLLKQKIAGNWMYLRCVVSEILREGRRSLESLPPDLIGYYAEYWGRWRQEPEWDRLYAPLLATLAAAREDASLAQLRCWAGLDSAGVYQLERLLKDKWVAYLFADGDRYRPYHASLRDFLSGNVPPEQLIQADQSLVKELAERTRQAHRQIAEHYRQATDGDWTKLAEADAGYGMRHLASHLAMAGAWDALYALLTDFDFLEARCRATSVFDLEADYRLALATWPQGDDKQRSVLAAFEERVRLEEHRIAQAPEWLFLALYNSLRWLDDPLPGLCEAAAERRSKQSDTLPLLRSRLNPRAKPSLWLRTLEGHTSIVAAVAVSPDSRFIVSGSHDRTVKVWDADSGQLLRALEGHIGPVTAVAVSLDGHFIISGSADRTVKVWDASSGQLLRSLEGHTTLVCAVTVSSDGCFIISGSKDCTVKVWDTHDGRLLHSARGQSWVCTVAASPDNRFIVSGSHDCTVKVWDASSGQLLRSLEGHTGWVCAIAACPKGRFITSGSDDHTVKVWDALGGELLHSLEGHISAVSAVAISRDSRFVVSGSADGTINVWNIYSGELLLSLRGHTGWVHAVAVSPNGRFIISGSADGTMKVWDTHTGELIRSLEGHTRLLNAAAASSGTRFVIGGSDDCTAKVQNAHSGQPLHTLEGHASLIYAIAVSPDSCFIVSGSADNTIKVWDASSGQLLRALEGHNDSVNSVVVSLDGRFIISGSADKTVRVQDADSGQLLHALEGHADWVNAVAVSSDGRFIVSGSRDRTVKVWDASSGQLLRTLEGHTSWVNAVAVSPDSRFIVSGSRDRTVKVWDASSGQLLRTLEGHTGRVYAVAVSPDSRFIVSRSADRTVKVWDASSGQLLRTLEGHTSWVNAVAVSPDGRFIVSGSADHTIRVWDLERNAGHVLFWNDAPIYSLALSRDGRLLACGDEVGRVWIFDVVWPGA